MNKPAQKNRTFPRKMGYRDRAIAEAPVQKAPEATVKTAEFAPESAPARSHDPDPLESLSSGALEQVANDHFDLIRVSESDPASDPEGQAAAQVMVDRSVALLAERGITWIAPQQAPEAGSTPE